MQFFKIDKPFLWFFICFQLVITTPLIAQSNAKYTVSGYVKDSKTGEYLIGANVYIRELVKGATG